MQLTAKKLAASHLALQDDKNTLPYLDMKPWREAISNGEVPVAEGEHAECIATLNEAFHAYLNDTSYIFAIIQVNSYTMDPSRHPTDSILVDAYTLAERGNTRLVLMPKTVILWLPKTYTLTCVQGVILQPEDTQATLETARTLWIDEPERDLEYILTLARTLH